MQQLLQLHPMLLIININLTIMVKIMTTKKQQAAEKMVPTKAPVDTDIDSQQRTQRELELKNWSEEKTHKVASDEGIE